MRQVFSSARIENVEAVADMLRGDGIEVRVVNGRSYRSAIRGNFSYRDQASSEARPSVWVVRSDEQPRARQLLREAGLLPSTRAPDESFLPSYHLSEPAGPPASSRKRSRLRYGLLAAIAVLAGLVLLSPRTQSPSVTETPPAPVASTAQAPDRPAAAASVATTGTFVIATPPALAEMLFARIRNTLAGDRACLAIDGADADADVLARLTEAGTPAATGGDCAEGGRGVQVDVREYRTDGSGIGSVEVVVHRPGGGRGGSGSVRRFEVQRVADDWRVLGER
jgi:hypothetical protein